jgi:hypothetical protein
MKSGKFKKEILFKNSKKITIELLNRPNKNNNENDNSIKYKKWILEAF